MNFKKPRTAGQMVADARSAATHGPTPANDPDHTPSSQSRDVGLRYSSYRPLSMPNSLSKRLPRRSIR